MAKRLSRRALATYIADEWVSGVDRTKLVRQLAAYLVESRRTDEVVLITRDIEAALAERGQVLARVTSANPLGAQLKDQLSKQIASSQGAKSVEIDETIDTDVLGGVKVELPGYELDATLRKRLRALKLRTIEQ